MLHGRLCRKSRTNRTETERKFASFKSKFTIKLSFSSIGLLSIFIYQTGCLIELYTANTQKSRNFVSIHNRRYPPLSAKAATMEVAGFYFHPAEKSSFFVIYYRCVTLADGKSLPLTREVDFAKQKTEGEKNLSELSPPVSHKCSTAPSSEGANKNPTAN